MGAMSEHLRSDTMIAVTRIGSVIAEAIARNSGGQLTWISGSIVGIVKW
jgi:hypothetical protein